MIDDLLYIKSAIIAVVIVPNNAPPTTAPMIFPREKPLKQIQIKTKIEWYDLIKEQNKTLK